MRELARILAVLSLPVLGLAAELQPDRTRDSALLAMEQVEDRSEELANDLVDLAAVVARRDFDAAAKWFTPSFSGEEPFSGAPQVARPRPGITLESWAPGAGKPVPALRWLGALAARMRNWRRVEDVRFKVKASRFDDASARAGDATIFSRYEGTDASGAPVAITLWLEARVAFEDGRFRLTSSRIKSLDSLWAATFSFRNIAGSAGVKSIGRSVADLADFNWNWQGAAAGDVNGDGRTDLFVPSVPANHLYINTGSGTFEDRAAAWGVDRPAGGTGVLFFDMDNDGDQDLFLCQVEGPGLKLFENTGQTFRDISKSSGVARSAFAYSAVAGDVDGDGLLDVYVACYNAFGKVAPSSWIRADNGTPNLLFLNQGGGKFRECAAERGVADGRWSYAALFSDLDEDGDVDLVVANDYGSKGLFINDGKGHFRDEAVARGAADPGNGMGVDCGDADGDGHLDLYFMNMSSTAGNRILKRLFAQGTGTEAQVIKLAAGNTLLRSDGSRFRDVTAQAAIGPAEWSWGGGFLDFDNDGSLDVHVANGFITGKTAKDT